MTQISETRSVALSTSIERAGYYPQLVRSVLDCALAGEEISSHLVHMETTFVTSEVKRHITVLVLTPTRLVLAHVDDQIHDGHDSEETSQAIATTESVRVDSIRSVVLSHLVSSPEQYTTTDIPIELSLTIGWGSVSRIDMEPLHCPDPNCDADHGYSGAVTGDDIMVRISATAEGQAAVAEAIAFSQALTRATVGL